MPAVLGIDAAWSENQPSGVALISKNELGTWRYVAVAPSYASFLELTPGNLNVDWEQRPVGGLPEPGRLLDKARELLKDAPVTVVAVDIPVANYLIVGRRPCDDEISRTFGALGCGTHSPTANRPGAISATLMDGLNHCGYPLVGCAGVRSDNEQSGRATIEVYPHPALVRLLKLQYRFPYKVQKSTRLWPKTPLADRVANLCASFHTLYGGLAAQIIGTPQGCVPVRVAGRKLASLKRYEDALDALVCAWVGACHLDNRAECYGDANAAIWVPQ